jgi:hypothetical protein
MIDRSHRVSGLLGPRFMLIRTQQPDRMAQARMALDNTAGNDGAKATLIAGVAALLATIPAVAPAFPLEIKEALAQLADFVTMARSPIERSRDLGGELDYAPEPEMPARFAKQLQSLSYGVALVRGHATVQAEDLAVAVRVGLDTIPEVRRAAVLALTSLGGRGSVSAVQRGLHGQSTQSERTTRRALEDLETLGVLINAGSETSRVYAFRFERHHELVARHVARGEVRR